MKYLEVGKIITTFGIKGEVKVKCDSSFEEERFKTGNTLYVKKENDKDYSKIKINTYRVHKDMALITFNDITNINQCLDYVGSTIFVNKDDLPKLNEGYYFDDLIGMKVIVNNEIIGEVIDILEVPQGEILKIRKNDNEKESLVPFVDEFINNVDIENKIIVITPIEGLL